MVTAQEILPASFRGVPFNVSSHTQIGGRKTVTHEYPNQTARYVEDLGGLLGRFSIRAIINNDPALGDYFARRIALKAALDYGGQGLLSHPYYGFKLVSVLGYSITEANIETGIGYFNIEFEETTSNIFPIYAGEKVGIISDLVNTSILSIGGEIASTIKLSSKNFDDTTNKQTELSNSLGKQLPPPAPIDNDSYNEFSNELDKFNDDKFKASADAQKLSDNIINILNNYSLISYENSYIYTLMRNLYDIYGSDDNDVISNAFYLQERRYNRNLLNSSIRGIALLYMFSSAAKITFTNSEDLKLTQDELKTRYELEAVSNTLKESIWAQFENIKFRTFKFFSQLKVNNVITAKITRHTITTFLYDYYENFNNETEIIKLNNINNPTILEGNIKMVTINE